MSAESVTAITDFLIGLETAFFAGMLFAVPSAKSSPLRSWSWAVLLLALAAFLGGVDHGFAAVDWPAQARSVVTRLTWVTLAFMTCFVLLTTGSGYFSARAYRVIRLVAYVQLVGFVGLSFASDSYLVVIVNYAPVILLLLAMNVLGLRSGKGSVDLVIGISILLVATVIQAAGVDVFSPLDRNGLYHVVTMLGIPFLYRGGLRLRSTPD